MNTEAPPPVPNAQPAKKRSCLGGCLIALVILVLLAGVGGFLGYKWGMGWLNDHVAEFEAQGYEAQWGQMIDVDEPVDKKMVYVGQSVKIRSNVNTDVAVFAQQAEIYGEIQGTLHFTGQILTIKGDAVIHGDVDIDVAQIAQIEGKVEGEVKGSYQLLTNEKGEVVTKPTP